ncbi:hypothetical protein HWV62_37759 [Athelia sp. TMB]|nr:hypothetical protein HWV62_37759 [Athelia sp. TMB]
MSESESKDADFFWLGRVPCRVVRIVGMVVGIQVYEKRITYTIDDGSAVIECVHRPVPPSPIKSKPNDKYKLPKAIKPLPELEPVTVVGASVRIVGKVMRWHDSRQIRTEIIEQCTCVKDELLHWRTVSHLHKSSYSLPEPFKIPPPSSTTCVPPPESQTVVTFDVEAPSSPMTASSAASSAHTTPSKPKVPNQSQSPPRLRHPSRLHSRDLTANTFRIYLKHFMDNAPLRSTLPISENDSICYALSQVPSTPTKRQHHDSRVVDVTPRPTRLQPLKLPGLELTPRAAQKAPHTSHEEPMGFTMSYLRRVPELADMARRVVKAEAKRRARGERERLRAQTQVSTSDKAGILSSSSSKTKSIPPEQLGAKMKRLFQVAIIKLYEEGSVVLFDGPARSIRDLDIANETSRLWKANSSTASADSTVFSVSSLSLAPSQEEDLGDISDPPAHKEEAYISLTPAHLAPHVEEAIRAIMGRPNQPVSKHRLAGPPPGPTKDEITRHLKRADARWAQVGEWVVEDALRVLEEEDRIWCVGKGKWELCL